MSENNSFTLKQHLTYFVLALLVSGTCFFLDVQFDNLPHNADKLAQHHESITNQQKLTVYQNADNKTKFIKI